MAIILGPQGEEIEARDVAVDGPGFTIPATKADSSVASGTDRDIVNTETAVLVGPQGEKIFPTADGICPVCGQQFPEACSQPGADLSAQPGSTPDPEAIREDDYIDEIDEPEDEDPNNAPADDRENMFELLRKRA